MPSDPFQMAMIHRTFRNEFSNLSRLIPEVAPGDHRRAAFIGGYYGNLLQVLHHHHSAEDEELWPKLQSRSAIGAEDVRLAAQEHRSIDEIVTIIEALRPSWSATPEPALSTQLDAATTELIAGLNAHFDHEEHTVLPLIRKHISEAEWQAFIDRGASYVGPSNVVFSLAYSGFLLRDATPDEQRRFLDSIPAPLRAVVKLFGGRANARYQTRLYGADRIH